MGVRFIEIKSEEEIKQEGRGKQIREVISNYKEIYQKQLIN